MFILKNGEKALSFSVDAYQYPAIEGNGKGDGFDYDANWLIVKITFFDGAEKMEQTDPCLLTCELQELVDGVWSVINGNESIYISEFMEPYLKFSAARTEAGITIGCVFSYDSSDGDWKVWGVSDTVSVEEAKRMSFELEAISEKFPQRKL